MGRSHTRNSSGFINHPLVDVLFLEVTVEEKLTLKWSSLFGGLQTLTHILNDLLTGVADRFN
jgi:hypothetical protein